VEVQRGGRGGADLNVAARDGEEPRDKDQPEADQFGHVEKGEESNAGASGAQGPPHRPQ
jgi:hypothetical protein